MACRLMYSILCLITVALFRATAIDKIIIDTDPGGDDAMAIMLALKRNISVDLLGITTVNGNSGVQNVTENVLKILRVMGRLDVPVYVGSAYSLTPGAKKTDDYFGYNGLCDFDYPKIPFKGHIRSTPAPTFLAEIVQEYPGEITLIALGPLTNVAMAWILNPNLLNQVKNMYIGGGSFPGHGALGDGYEFNTALDPNAAQLILDRYQTDKSPRLILIPSGSANHSTIEWRRNVLGVKPTSDVHFLNQAQGCTLNRSDWSGGDANVMAAFLEPSTIISQFIGSLSVRSDGYSTVIRGNSENPGNLVIVPQLNETRLQSFFLDTL